MIPTISGYGVPRALRFKKARPLFHMINCLQWKMSFCAHMRAPFLLVLVVVCFFGLRPISASALTESEVQNAVYHALTTAPLNFSGSQLNVVPWMYPALSAPTIGEWLMYTFGIDETQASRLPSADTLARSLWTIRDTLLVLTNDVHDSSVDISSLSSAVTNLLREIEFIRYSVDPLSYTAGGSLLVHDDAVVDAVNQLIVSEDENAHILSNQVDDVIMGMMTLTETATELLVSVDLGNAYWEALFDHMGNALDLANTASNVVSSNVSSGDEQSNDTLVDAENSMLERQDNPPVMESYETADQETGEYDSGLLDADDQRVSSLSADVHHSTVVTLLSTANAQASTGVPFLMEFDIFRTLDGTISKMDTIMRTGWATYFSLLSFVLFLKYQTRISSALRGFSVSN